MLVHSKFFDKSKLSMDWVETIELLVRYFRIDDHNPEEPVCEIVVDERFELKVICLEGQLLAFFGYFTGEIMGSDLPRLKNMLQWNLARVADTDDTLSIESESNRLCLFRKRPLATLFADSRFGEVESFITNLAFWADAFDYFREVPRGSNLMVFGV
jgi:hypothetical protein